VRPTEIEETADELYARREFFTRLGQPSFKFRPAEKHTPPLSEDCNAMLVEAVEDIAFLRDAAQAIAEQIQNNFNFHVAELQALKSRLPSFRDVYSSLPGLYRIKEDFTSGRAFRAAAFPLARVIPYAVTLQEERSEDVSSSAFVRILPGDSADGITGSYSNGFPGNIHEYFGGNFVGYTNAHADYAAVLDGNPDTWFEYELVSLLPEHRPRYGRYFTFKGARVLWDRAPEGGQLVLALELMWEKPVTVSQFVLNFYAPARGYSPVLKKVKVSSDGVEPPVTLSAFSHYVNAGELVVSFAPRQCRVAQFFFAQPFAYLTEVGCLYYSDGDIALSLEKLGVDEGGYSYRKNPSLVALKDALAGIPQWEVTVVPALRYVIGIRDIRANSAVYVPASEVISDWYELPFYPSRLMLFVDDNVPPGTSIEYAVSADGVTWSPVTPLGRGPKDVLEVVIDPLWREAAEVGDGTLILRQPTNKFMIRAVLRSDNSAITPVLRSYELISVPEGVLSVGTG